MKNSVLMRVTSVLSLLFLSLGNYSAAEELPVYEKWGGNFTLTDHNGFEISLSDFRDKVVLLTFGFTHCPDVCPNTLFSLRSAVEKLGDDAANVHVIFITLDPERDYVERLQAFVEYFNPNFLALSGSVDEIKSVAELYHMPFQKVFMEGSDVEYSIDHAAAIYVIDQQGLTRAIFKITAPPQLIAEDVKQLLFAKQTMQ